METTTNPERLEFHEVVVEQIELFNSILGEKGIPKLFQNPDVKVDKWWQFEHYLKFRISRANSATLDFHFAADGLRIDFNGYDEAYEVTSKVILEEKSKVRKLLQSLICCPILVESKGGAQFVNLFNPDGSRYAIWALQSLGGLLGGYWKSLDIDQRLYDPVYPNTN